MKFSHCVASSTGVHLPDDVASSTGCSQSNRKMCCRFEFSENSRSAFVELSPQFFIGPQEFKRWLESVPRVRMVWFAGSEGRDVNVDRDHFLDPRLFVRSTDVKKTDSF